MRGSDRWKQAGYTIDGFALCKIAIVLLCEEGIAVATDDAFEISSIFSIMVIIVKEVHTRC